MVVRRRARHGLGPVMVGASALLLVACGASDAISADVNKPSPNVEPNACSLLSDSAVSAALAPPAGAAASPTPTAAAAVSHSYAVVSVNEGGQKTAGQCVWTDASGGQVIALLYPQADITKIADYTTGAVQAGSAYIQEGNGRGFVAIQHGGGVIAITLVLDADPSVRTSRLADLARTASGASIPVISAAPSASATATAGGPVANAPGQQVTGQSASQTVKESDALKFNPNSTTVAVGQVVEWDNTGSVAHNVTFDQYSTITSDTMNGGDKYQVKFTKAGTYQYHCTFHPGMDGTITVH